MQRRWLVLLSLIVALVFWSVPGWAQQPKPGGTLRLAMPGDMTFFNANQGPAPGYFTYWVWNNIFNSLLTMTPPPEWKVVPELATSWDVQDGGRGAGRGFSTSPRGCNSTMARTSTPRPPSGISTASSIRRCIPGCG